MRSSSMARALLALALLSGLASIAFAEGSNPRSTARALLGHKWQPKTDKPACHNCKPQVEEPKKNTWWYTNTNSVPDLTVRDLCTSNVAFDYSVWKFRTGYKAKCCAYCAEGAMDTICKNVYDEKQNRYYACASPESQAPCTDPHAPIPSKPVCQTCQPKTEQPKEEKPKCNNCQPKTEQPKTEKPKEEWGYTNTNSVPDLTVRDLCTSNVAFDYGVWQFRAGYKAKCCAYCAEGAMDAICKNVYDEKQNRYYACASPESQAPCTDPHAPIPSKPVCQTCQPKTEQPKTEKPKEEWGYTNTNSVPDLTVRDLCTSNVAFDYGVWQFRAGYKAKCCAYCAEGAMDTICKNVYDEMQNRYYACASPESQAPCTDPHAPIPSKVPCKTCKH